MTLVFVKFGSPIPDEKTPCGNNCLKDTQILYELYAYVYLIIYTEPVGHHQYINIILENDGFGEDVFIRVIQESPLVCFGYALYVYGCWRMIGNVNMRM